MKTELGPGFIAENRIKYFFNFLQNNKQTLGLSFNKGRHAKTISIGCMFLFSFFVQNKI